MSKKTFVSEETIAAGLWALYEVLFITFLSLMPLFLIAYYQFVTQNGGNIPQATDPNYIPIGKFVYGNTAAGQLAFYGIANWIAVAWLCTLEKGVHIPMRALFVALCIAGFSYCGILIGITAAKNYVPSTAVTQPSLVVSNGKMATLKLSNFPHDETSKRILFKEIAVVIDGQHRIDALRQVSDEFDVNVAIFVGLDKATEAEIFSTVNLAQTKVNRSLVYDLFEYRKQRSPEKTCHEVAVVLDRDKRSPFAKKIKRLGVATEGRFGETLSQATFVEGLLSHISKDPVLDREAGRRLGIWPTVKQNEFEKCVLRPFFKDNADEKIVSVIWNYFDAVKERWPAAWDDDGRKYVLNRSTGYLGLMRFFRPAYLHITTSPRVIEKDEFTDLFNASQLKSEDFTKEVFIPGTSGQAEISRRLREDCLS